MRSLFLGKTILVLLYLNSALLLLSALPATAQSERSVNVVQRDADITILQNGDARFGETWVVDFRNGAFTFAFREIPKVRLREIADWRVSEGEVQYTPNGGEHSFSVTETQDNYKITWTFPRTNQGAQFLSDPHTFTLGYTVHGALRMYPGGDQFYWKFIEPNRRYTIQSAKVTLHLPGDFPTDQLKATSYTDNRETGGARFINGSTIEFNRGAVAPNAEWEIRAQFPHVISAPPEAWQQLQDEQDRFVARNNFLAIVAALVILIGGGLTLLVLWYLFGRDKPSTFASEYIAAPPDETPPGVVGTLLDERADLQDILATVVDLARRGFIRIRESNAFGETDFERVNHAPSALEPFETQTLDALLRGGPMRRLSDVRGSFYSNLDSLKSALYDAVVQAGFFPSSPLATRDGYFAFAKWAAVITVSVGFCASIVSLSSAPMLFLPILALVLVEIALMGLSRTMPQRTSQGSTAAAKWNAFKRYLALIEKYTNVADARDQFEKYLPYAIAFGLDKSWIEKFSKADTPAPAWYIPSTSAANTPIFSNQGESGRWDTNDDASPAPVSTASSASTPVFPPPFRPSPNGRGVGDRSSRNALEEAESGFWRDDLSGGEGTYVPTLSPPTLNDISGSAFTALNTVNTNLFDFLNTSASAFTERPPSRSGAESFLDGVGELLSWFGSSGSSSSSSSSDSSWSSSSSSSSSSSWSGGGSSGGRGSGGGSSGFG